MDDENMDDEVKLSPKEYAREMRKKAYQKAKKQRKEYLEKQKNNLTDEQKARNESIKEKQREQRRQAYARAKSLKKLQSDKEKQKAKEAKAKELKEKYSLENLNSLQLLTFDRETESLQPMKTPPPKLRVISNRDS